jgi:hypothetical protein
VSILAAAIPPDAAAQIALDSATAADDAAAQASEEDAARLSGAGHGRVLTRSLHRREHLAALRRVIASSAA